MSIFIHQKAFAYARFLHPCAGISAQRRLTINRWVENPSGRAVRLAASSEHGSAPSGEGRIAKAVSTEILHFFARVVVLLAFTELQCSNSMIEEAWWRSLTHQWLFLHSLDSVTTVRRLVEFYVDEHNRVLPHAAFRGQTPDEMYVGTGDVVPADLTSGAAAARRARAQANRSAACRTCPSLDTAA